MRSSNNNNQSAQVTKSESGMVDEMNTIFCIYVFQPKEDFYTLNFETKMKLLEEKILIASKHSEQQTSKPNKNIFIAPEYLFKDVSKKGPDSYYSREEKNKLKNKLIELSKNLKSDLILIPGSICWKKASKSDQKIYYRNMLYVVHNGEIQKYKKRNPALSYDFDFAKGKLNNHKFFKKGTEGNIINVSNICIGVEICLDHAVGELKNSNHLNEIHAQIIIADGIAEDNHNFISKAGALTLKVERTSHFKTVIGQQQFSSQNVNNMTTIELKPPDKSEAILEDMTCYTFNNVLLRNEKKISNEK